MTDLVGGGGYDLSEPSPDGPVGPVGPDGP